MWRAHIALVLFLVARAEELFQRLLGEVVLRIQPNWVRKKCKSGRLMKRGRGAGPFFFAFWAIRFANERKRVSSDAPELFARGLQSWGGA